MAERDNEDLLFREEERTKSFKRNSTEELTNAIKDLRSTMERIDRQNKNSFNMRTAAVGAAGLATGAVAGGLAYTGMQMMGGPGLDAQLRANPTSIDSPMTRYGVNLISSPLDALRYKLGEAMTGNGLNGMLFDRKAINRQNLIASKYINDSTSGYVLSGIGLDAAGRVLDVTSTFGMATAGIIGGAGAAANALGKGAQFAEIMGGKTMSKVGMGAKIFGGLSGFGVQAGLMVGKAFVTDALNQRAAYINTKNSMTSTSWSHVYGENADNPLGEGYSNVTKAKIAASVIKEGYSDKWYDIKDISGATSSIFATGLDADIQTDDVEKVRKRIKDMIGAAKKISAVLGGTLSESVNELKKMELLGSTSKTDMIFSLTMESARKSLGLDRQSMMNVAGNVNDYTKNKGGAGIFGTTAAIVATRTIGAVTSSLGEEFKKQGMTDQEVESRIKDINENKDQYSINLGKYVSDTINDRNVIWGLAKKSASGKGYGVDKSMLEGLKNGKISYKDLISAGIKNINNWGVEETSLNYNFMKSQVSMSISQNPDEADGLMGATLDRIGTELSFLDKNGRINEVYKVTGRMASTLLEKGYVKDVDEGLVYENIFKSHYNKSLVDKIERQKTNENIRQIQAVDAKNTLSVANYGVSLEYAGRKFVFNLNPLGTKGDKEIAKAERAEAETKFNSGDSYFMKDGRNKSEIAKELEIGLISQKIAGSSFEKTARSWRTTATLNNSHEQKTTFGSAETKTEMERYFLGKLDDVEKKELEKKDTETKLRYVMRKMNFKQQNIDENMEIYNRADMALSDKEVKDSIKGIEVDDNPLIRLSKEAGYAAASALNKEGDVLNVGTIESFIKPESGLIEKVSENIRKGKLLMNNGKVGGKSFDQYLLETIKKAAKSLEKGDNDGYKDVIKDYEDKIKKNATKGNESAALAIFESTFNSITERSSENAMISSNLESLILLKPIQKKGANGAMVDYEETAAALSLDLANSKQEEKNVMLGTLFTKDSGGNFAMYNKDGTAMYKGDEERRILSQIIFNAGRGIKLDAMQLVDAGTNIMSDTSLREFSSKLKISLKSKYGKELDIDGIKNKRELVERASKLLNDEISAMDVAKGFKVSETKETQRAERINKYKELADTLDMNTIWSSLRTIAINTSLKSRDDKKKELKRVKDDYDRESKSKDDRISGYYTQQGE